MAESFIAGFAYGATTVFVGQPLDTIKTLQQTQNVAASNKSPSIISISKNLYSSGGIMAFYRGGIPLLLGGGLMRSAQFGVYKNALQSIRTWEGRGPLDAQDRFFFGLLDYQVIFAGFLGGIGRGMVEGPFEMIKVRQQVQTKWNMKEILKGSGTTLLRNSFLFMSFAIYMDISDQLTGGLSPFWKGGICANLAWLTIWPLDVTKSRLQSGKFEGKSLIHVLTDIIKSRQLFQGLLPGLTRSFIANGSSMVVYTRVESELKKQWGRD